MPDFNMPPGVSVRDIPGNTPDEQEAEAFFDLVYDKLEEVAPATSSLMDEEERNAFVTWLWGLMGNAYSKGYADGGNDAAVVASWDKEDKERK
jgi:hypothetical protein